MFSIKYHHHFDVWSKRAERVVTLSKRVQRKLRYPEKLCAILQNIGAFNTHRGNNELAEAQLQICFTLSLIGYRDMEDKRSQLHQWEWESQNLHFLEANSKVVKILDNK